MDLDTDIRVRKYQGIITVDCKCPSCRKWSPMSPKGGGVYVVSFHLDKYGICSGVGKMAQLGKIAYSNGR